MKILASCLLWLCLAILVSAEETEVENGHKIEGKVTPPDVRPSNWFTDTSITLDGGKRRTFLREDNSFVFQGLPSGTFLVEVENPDYLYEQVRVDINSKGKHRARKNNVVQPNQVTQLPYPIKAKPLGKFRYFQKREEWKVTDVLFNPMVMMMVMPLLLITVLPKMMQDPETKKEMEEMQAKMSVQGQMPEMSEMLTNLLNGRAPTAPKKKAGGGGERGAPVRRRPQ